MTTHAKAAKVFEYRLDENPEKKKPSYALVWAVLKRGVASLHWYIAAIGVAFTQVFIQFLVPIPGAIIVGSILPMVADPATRGQALIVCCIAWAGIQAISALVSLCYQYLTSEGSLELMLHLRRRFLNELENLDDDDREELGTGRLYTTYNTDLRSYALFYSQFLPPLLADSLRVIGTFGIIYVLSPPIFWFLFMVIPLQILLMTFFRWRIQGLHRKVNRIRDEAMSLFNESLVNSELIKSFNAQKRITDKTVEKVEEMINQARKARNRRVIWTLASRLVSMVFSVGIVLISGIQVIDGAISLTFYIVINSYAQAVLVPIQSLITSFQGIIPLLVGVQWCEEFFGIAEKHKEGKQNVSVPVRTLPIEFRNVTFSYPGTAEGARPAIENVSCRLEAGGIVVICGPSGGGKSTFLKLLRGALPPQSGQVLIGGVDISRIDKDNLSKLVAMLSQKISLLSMSIVENAQLLSPRSREEDLKESLKMANILKELEELEQEIPHEVDDPESTFLGSFVGHIFGLPGKKARVLETRRGLDRVAGTSGNLSGGQQQRVSIGFALLTRCPILLFDEPTSGLDKFSENELVETISRLGNGDRTIVVVSHTLPPYFTLPDDKVHFLFFDEGRLKAEGRRKELLQNCPEFRALARENVRHVLQMDREDLDLLIDS